MAAVTLGALVSAAAFRSSTGALFEPLEAEFGWSRTTTSGAVTLNLVVYGLTAPFAAALMERFGIRRVVAISLAVVGTASALTTFMTAAWQLWLLWGVAIGAGTGSMALVFGAIVANRWFEAQRGLVTGRLLGGERDRPAGLPAGHRRARGGPGLAGRRARRHRRRARCSCPSCSGAGDSPAAVGTHAVRRPAPDRPRAGRRGVAGLRARTSMWRRGGGPRRA